MRTKRNHCDIEVFSFQSIQKVFCYFVVFLDFFFDIKGEFNTYPLSEYRNKEEIIKSRSEEDGLSHKFFIVSNYFALITLVVSKNVSNELSRKDVQFTVTQ